MSLEEERGRMRKLLADAQNMQGIPAILTAGMAQSRPKTAEEVREEARQMINVWPTPNHDVSSTRVKKRWHERLAFWRKS